MHRLIIPVLGIVAVALLLMLISRPRSLATVETFLASAPRFAVDVSGAGDDSLIAARDARAAPALAEGTWINSDPLKLADLRGRVVVVDFWTFGCYNCRNTLPALKRWDKAYRERGLTIVGVHSPEFDHEKNLDNVRRQVRSLGIRYPVVTDNDYATWRAYGIQAWPTVVILDKQGHIRWTHIGEGMYAEQEDVIKRLLAEEFKGERPGGQTKAETDSNEDRNGVSSNPQGSRSDELKGPSMTQKVTRTDEEWRQILTPEQFYVTRQKGTEMAFTGEYYASKEKGVYLCVACGNELFRSDTKFDSGTGWPSFWAPVAESNVKLEEDRSHGMRRTEVMCSRCGAHLGHVFDDGPEPTHLRYCINSVALKFKKL